MKLVFALKLWFAIQGRVMPCEKQVEKTGDFHYRNMRLVPSNIPAVLEVKIKANASSSCVVDEQGVTPHFLKWITHRFNISYSWEHKVNDVLVVEDSPGRKGLVSFIRNGEADVIAGGLTLTAERFRSFDFTFPWWVGSFVLMIPYPSKDINNKALIQPFQLEVWTCLILGFVSVITSWYIISREPQRLLHKKIIKPQTDAHLGYLKKGKHRLFRPLEYAFSVLLSQGNFCLEKSLAVRLIASTWCLAAFVLYPAYSGTLISFIMSPTIKPIVNSIRDVPNVAGLNIAVDRGFGTDAIFQAVKNNETTFERLVNHLKPSMMRCNATRACLDGVRNGRYIYAHTMILVNNVIYDELEKAGKCTFSRAREAFQAAFISMGVAKGSPFLNIINKGLMEMDAFGLLYYWNAKYFKEAKECIKINKAIGKKQLTLAELGTTFVLLGTGYALGSIAFVGESIVSKRISKSRK